MDCASKLTLHCPVDCHGPFISSSASPDAYLQNIFLLLVTACLKIGLTAYTFGMKVCGEL